MRSKIDLQAILHSSEIGREWPAVEKHLETVFSVPDGTTGAVNPGDRRAIYYLTRHFKPTHVLEIGTHVGGSTLHFAVALDHGAKLTTVDVQDVNGLEGPWQKAGLAGPPRQLLERLGVRAEFVVADSLVFFGRTSERYDLIFLDGDHSCERVIAEIVAARGVLKTGGLILLHDYFPDGVNCWEGGSLIDGPYEAVRWLIREGLPIQVVPLGTLPWPTKLGSHVTSLAVLLSRGGVTERTSTLGAGKPRSG